MWWTVSKKGILCKAGWLWLKVGRSHTAEELETERYHLGKRLAQVVFLCLQVRTELQGGGKNNFYNGFWCYQETG